MELLEYRGFGGVKERIGEFIEEVYQEKWTHSELGYLTPTEFEEKWHREWEIAASLSKDGRETVQLLGSTKINGWIRAAKARARRYWSTRNLINMAHLLAGKVDFGQPT
ncbi:MAG: hypothetical protein JRI56_04910 [Deltaproteobacteria bacterium]|nr:hypothetical protein [Deltaproteobacteria bacterium]